MKTLLTAAFLSLIFVHVDAQTKVPDTLGLNLENYHYPYPVQYITVASQRMVYWMAYMDVQPDKRNGETVMLLHGKNFNGAYWEQTAKRLAAEGYRVIIPDQIGFGKSSKPDDYHYTFQQLSRNTRALLDSLNLRRVAVLGHSMGGMLATRFALMYPDRVSKLILVNPIGLEDWKTVVPYQPIEHWCQQELKQNYDKIKAYQLENYYHGEWKPAYEEWARVLAGWTNNIDYQIIAWNAALTYDMIFTQPVVYEFKNLKMPVLLIIGQLDRTALGKNLVSEEVRKTLGNYPRLGKEIQKQIPQAELAELAKVGHLPHIEAFQEFITPLLLFLKK